VTAVLRTKNRVIDVAIFLNKHPGREQAHHCTCQTSGRPLGELLPPAIITITTHHGYCSRCLYRGDKVPFLVLSVCGLRRELKSYSTDFDKSLERLGMARGYWRSGFCCAFLIIQDYLPLGDRP